MHAMINDNAVRSSNCYNYNKCATTRSEYNDRLTSLLNRNKELEVELQNEQRLNQRYQIKTNVQNILIEELINIHSPTLDNDSDDRNKENDLLLIKNAKRVAELSMEIEDMKQQQQQQQRGNNNEQHESLVPLLNLNHDDNDKGVDDDDDDDTTQSLSSDGSNDELLVLLEKERADYFENKNKSLERSVETFKYKNSEREIRHAIAFRNMRNQIESLEIQLKRNSLQLQLQEIDEEQEARRNQFEVENIKLKLTLTHYRRQS